MTQQSVLITGTSSGIGRVTALAFLDAGWSVYATARDTADVESLAEAGAETMELDVTAPEDCVRVVAEIVDAEGQLDCLVNNAGYGQFGAVEDVTTRRLHQQFDVNLYGPHRLIREVLPHMREAGAGTIINVSSVLGRISVPGYGAYAGSKFALEALSDALRAEVAEFDIDVVLVEPGPTETSFYERSNDSTASLEKTGVYETLYQARDDAKSVYSVGAIQPADVATTILEGASSRNPAPRYPVGPIARLGGIARILPDRWRDTAYRLLSKVA